MRRTPLLAVSAALALQSLDVGAITLARITRRGYIVVDDGGTWGRNIPTGNTRDMASFIAETTTALADVPGFHQGKYLAAMQIPSTQSPLAFYLPIRNDVRGLGQRSVIDGRSEVFDTNSFYDTAFPLDGFVYLNSYRFYTDPRAVIFGRFLICTQEFGHRFGTNVAVPSFPTGTGGRPATDAGVDAGADASVDATADVPRDVAPDLAPDAPRDASADVAVSDVTVDGAVDDVPAGTPALARDGLLGRGNQTTTGMVVNRSHWSYFVNSGGSPMEGNAWTEISPGMFRTERPTFRFSPIDLYLMGLVPASEVPPTFLIAEPTNLPRNVTRDSPPEYYNRQVTIRGRRVDVGIDDIVRANGARNPAYPNAPRDLDVVWVLLAEPEDIDDQLAAEFDEAVDSCAMGYAFATAERGRLVTTVPAQPDAATPPTDASTADASARDSGFDPDVPNLPPPDGMTVGDGATASPPLSAAGGCQCAVGAAAPSRSGGCAALALAALAFCRRTRRRRAA